MKKKKKEQIKEWIEDHKKIITYAGMATGGAIILGMIKRSLSDEYCEDDDFDESDFGRDCVMRFFVENSDEQIGKDVRCTESFAREWNEAYADENEKD